MSNKNKNPGKWDGNSFERGMKAEQAFLDAWADKGKYPSFIFHVRKATEFEDKKRKTDAVIKIYYGIRMYIKIQIKAHRISIRDRNEFLKLKIAPLTIRKNHTPEMIRINTLKSILSLLLYIYDGTLITEPEIETKQKSKPTNTTNT